MKTYLIHADGADPIIVHNSETICRFHWATHIEANDDLADICRRAGDAVAGHVKLPVAEAAEAIPLLADLGIRTECATVLILDAPDEPGPVQTKPPTSTAELIALGQLPRDNTKVRQARAAWHDYSTTLKTGHTVYRMIYNATTNSWEYLPGRLPRLCYQTRKTTIHAHVYSGDILAEHERAKPIDTIYLVDADQKDHLIPLPFIRTRDHQLRITLPSGDKLTLPDPRQ